jgi:hypothetical protein
MILGLSLQPPDFDEQQAGSRVRRLALLLFLLLVSFSCMLLATQLALRGLRPAPLQRDVRSAVSVDYGSGERRAAPLIPDVIEAVRKDVETPRPTQAAESVTVVPVVVIPLTATAAIAQVTPSPTPTPVPPATATAAASATAEAISTATAVQVPSPTAVATSAATEAPSATPPATTLPPTPRPTDTAVPTPFVPTSTPVPPPTHTPTSLPPPPPTNTWTPPPAITPSATMPSPTVTDTPSPTASATPMPSDTPTATPMPSDTPTATPMPSNTPTATPTPTGTPTDTPTPVPPPIIDAIIPNQIVHGLSSDPAIITTIFGAHFSGSLAWLGENIQINVTDLSSTVISGTLAPDTPSGIYALTVQNADAQQATLPRAFTVLPPSRPSTTVDSDTAFISTAGSGVPPAQGDDDHVQVVFFEVADGPNDPFYVRIFDPDTGGAYDEVGLDNAFGDTVTTLTLRGGPGAYTEPDARSPHPGTAGISSGQIITQQTIAADSALDNTWLTWPLQRNQGELVGGSRVFKLVVEGTSGDDINWYQLAFSTSPGDNSAVPGARVFAYSWSAVLPGVGDNMALYPFVPAGTDRLTQFNFDLDLSPGTNVTLTTPLRNLPVIGLSGNSEVASQQFTLFSGERAVTWTARYTSAYPPGSNLFSVWFLADDVTPSLIPPP